MCINNFSIPVNVMMVQDSEMEGYTVFFSQFPNIITEGNAENEAMDNLINAVHDGVKYKSRNEFAGTDYKTINLFGKFYFQ